jgi:hypothetical protein
MRQNRDLTAMPSSRCRKVLSISLYAEMFIDAVRDPDLLELWRQANITEMFLFHLRQYAAKHS